MKEASLSHLNYSLTVNLNCLVHPLHKGNAMCSAIIHVAPILSHLGWELVQETYSSSASNIVHYINKGNTLASW